jgi:hypothetical protein
MYLRELRDVLTYVLVVEGLPRFAPQWSEIFEL